MAKDGNPMRSNSIIQILKDRYAGFTDSQKKIGRYILDHYETVVFMSAVELSKAVGVSDVTVIRFVRSLGFDGFVDFKKSLREGSRIFDTPAAWLSQTLDSIGSKTEINREIYQNDLDNLSRLMADLDQEVIDKIVRTIYTVKTVYVFGMGTSAMIAAWLALHLRRMGFNTVAASEDNLDGHEKLLGITEQDALLTFSFPRYSRSSYHAILFAKQKGAARITITDSSSSILSLNSDTVVPIKIDTVSFFNSYIAPLEFCNILIMNILAYDSETIRRKVEANMRSLNQFNTKL